MRATALKNNVTIFGQGPQTIVFAHGFGTDQTAWKHITPQFSDRYRLVLFDNVAAGKADPASYSPNKYNSLEPYAQDLIDICKVIGLENAYYVGHSVSGMIGMLAASERPEIFSKMVFIGASPRYLNDEGYLGGFNQNDLDNLFDAMTNNYYAWVNGFAGLAMGNPDKPELAAEFAKSLSSLRPDVAIAVAKTIFQSDYRTKLPNFLSNTLIIQSNQDIAVPNEVGRYLHAHIKNSEFKQIDATGHLPHISAPEIVTEVIKSFFE